MALINQETRKRWQAQGRDLLHRSLDRHVRLAVTGLSRSGKTAFITALVHQLLHADVTRLPFWNLVREDRLYGVRRVPQTRHHIPSFGYDQAMANLSSQPPRWPEPTNGISEIRLELRFRPQRGLLGQLQDKASLFLEIVDYPGEWLLDLPLLELDYGQWSALMGRWLEQSSVRELATPWLEALARTELLAAADEAQLAQLAGLYTDFLHAAKARGLHLIQPGRFVLPGELAGAPLLAFCPLVALPEDTLNAWQQAPEGSNLGMMRERYEYYKRHVVRGFYHTHFAGFDRQIVLVDCLQPLNAGPESFADLKQAIGLLMQSFAYGKNRWWRRLLSPRIDKLLIAASKADHVTPDQHEHLLQLLRLLVAEGARHAQFEGVGMDCCALASIRATESGKVYHDGEWLPAIKGCRLDDHQSIQLFPGEVPAHLPDNGYWRNQGFRFIDFAPQARAEGMPLEHIRLDVALEYLLGDKLL